MDEVNFTDNELVYHIRNTLKSIVLYVSPVLYTFGRVKLRCSTVVHYSYHDITFIPDFA